MHCLGPVLCVLFITAACGATQLTTESFFNGVDAQLEDLRAARRLLCGTNGSTPQPMGIAAGYRQLVTWKSVPLTLLETILIRESGTLSFEIPNVIPKDAIEVLILAYFRFAASSGLESFFKIFTEGDEGEEYAKYIVLVPHGGGVWNTNSDNLWFPMPSSRRIFIDVPHTLGGNTYGGLYAIGYR